MEDQTPPLFMPEGTKKTMPAGVTGTGTIRTQIEPLYAEKLDFAAIKNNPVLKPLSEINNGYINMELLINRALWEYQENKLQIDAMIQENPKYSETIILSKFQNILNYIKQIIQAQDIQKENMKRAINEMIKIVGEEYGILEEEQVPKKINKAETKHPSEEIVEIKEGGIIPEADKNATPQEFYSELLDKEIPVQKKKGKREGYIPILNEESGTNIN